MADTQQWISLEECIYAYISRAELSESKYLKLWNIAYDFMVLKGLDAFFSVTSVLLPVNANMTVSLPDNYLQYTKVGVLNAGGEVATIRRNDRLSKLKPFSNSRQPSQLSTDFVNGSFASDDYSNYWNNGCLSNIYGCGYYDGGFTINEKDGLLFLSGGIAENIVLEYLSSPPPDEQYKIPVQFKQACIAYLSMEDIKYVSPRRGMAGVINMRRQDYFNESRLAKKRYQPFRLDEALQISIPRLRINYLTLI